VGGKEGVLFLQKEGESVFIVSNGETGKRQKNPSKKGGRSKVLSLIRKALSVKGTLFENPKGGEKEIMRGKGGRGERGRGRS